MNTDLTELLLLVLLAVCGIAACTAKNLMVSLIIFMAYSIIMSVIWGLLKAPDLAVTEAAVGAGISGILMFITLNRIRKIRREAEEADEETDI